LGYFTENCDVGLASKYYQLKTIDKFDLINSKSNYLPILFSKQPFKLFPWRKTANNKPLEPFKNIAFANVYQFTRINIPARKGACKNHANERRKRENRSGGEMQCARRFRCNNFKIIQKQLKKRIITINDKEGREICN